MTTTTSTTPGHHHLISRERRPPPPTIHRVCFFPSFFLFPLPSFFLSFFLYQTYFNSLLLLWEGDPVLLLLHYLLMYRTLRHPLPPPSLPLPPHPVIPQSHLPPPHHSHHDLKKKCQQICKIYVSSEIHKLSFELLRIFLFFAANCTYLTIVFYQFNLYKLKTE